MKILIVINDYMNKSNGMCISTQRFVEEFRRAGHEVRIATNNRYGETDYPMEVLHIPIFAGIIEKEGFTFAKADRELLQKAIEWADLVHLEDPFVLCAVAADIAKEQRKPVTGTFHLYPENMTYAVHMGKAKSINRGFMKGFLHTVYDKCDFIQCPTENVKNRLLQYHEKKTLRVISNGIGDEFLGLERLPHNDDELHILSVGRLAVEKNQKLLLQALALCKHRENFRVTIAGKGPLEEELKHMAQTLGVEVTFAFFSQDDLKKEMLSADLYIHCADIEVEGMSCMEAFACGAVPIIAQAGLSSTKLYALTEENKFQAGDAEELAARIDHFYENPEERMELSKKYMEYASSLSIKSCAEKLLDMMKEAVKMGEKS